MDKREFLALVEKYPGAWAFLDANEGVFPSEPCYIRHGQCETLEGPDAQALADAAPAMAHAILRFIRAQHVLDTTPVTAANLDSHYALIRAKDDAFEALLPSLPKDLQA